MLFCNSPCRRKCVFPSEVLQPFPEGLRPSGFRGSWVQRPLSWHDVNLQRGSNTAELTSWKGGNKHLPTYNMTGSMAWHGGCEPNRSKAGKSSTGQFATSSLTRPAGSMDAVREVGKQQSTRRTLARLPTARHDKL